MWDRSECAFTAGFESRAAFRALVDAPGGQIQVVSTHLAHSITNLSSVSRVAQNEALQRWIAEFSHGSAVPVVLTGDFNSAPGSQVHSGRSLRGSSTPSPSHDPTDPGFTSSQEIDAPSPTVGSGSTTCSRILVRVPHRWAKVPASWAARSSGTHRVSGKRFLWPSDHYGVVSEIRPFPTAPDACPLTYIARYSPEACTTLARIARTEGAAVADVIRFGVDLFAALADAGRADARHATRQRRTVQGRRGLPSSTS